MNFDIIYNIYDIFPALPSFSFVFSSSVSSTGPSEGDIDGVGINVLWEQLSLITIVGQFLEKTVLIG